MTRSHQNIIASSGAEEKAGSFNLFIFIILFLCYAVNILDRSIISFVSIPLKSALHLSDAQFGVLTGPVFSVTYGVFSFFFAYYADRGNRAKVLFAVLILWSAATAACSLATSFLQVLLARLLVGIGEAGGTPTAMALVTDSVPRERLSSAFAIFILASPCGLLSAAVAGSYLAEHYGWRMAFLACGAIGIPLALVIGFKLRDPRLGAQSAKPAKPVDLSPGKMIAGIGEAFRVMAGRQSLLFVLAGFSASFFLGTGVLTWGPIFFSRYHGLNARDASLYVGLLFCAGMVPGMLVGGFITDRLAKRDVNWSVYVPALALALSVPALFVAFRAGDLHIAFGAFTVAAFFSQMSVGPMVGAFNALLPSGIRAMGNSSLQLGAAVVSGGLGNVLVGTLSDQLSPALGVSSLRLVLVAVTAVLGMLSVAFLLLASRHFVRNLGDAGW